MRLPALTLAACVALGLAALAQQPPPATFRSGVDLITVDVQVVDKTGAPVVGLTADQFEVTVDGKRRKVVSAELLRFATSSISASTPAAPEASAPAAPAPAPASAPAPAEGRIYILAFDAMSFKPLEVAPARQAARKFLDQLQPNDLAGFVAFPGGLVVDLTTDRAPVIKAVDEIVGQAAPASMNAFNLTPSEIVDLSALPTDSPELASVPLQMRIAEICRDSRMPLCGRMVVPDAKMMARIEEAEIARRVGGFQAMLNSLAESPRRKIVVLISAGLLHSDNASGQPQLGDIGRMVGQSAAQANAVVYSLHFDNRHLGMMGASQASMGRMPTLRDNFVVSNSLHRIADTSGGAFFNVVTGGGEHAFDRVIKETTSYYLLGVEAAASDRDGRSHQVTVKTSQKNVTLRNRSWVTLSKPVAATGPVTRTVLRTRGSAPKALPAQARPIVEAYARRDYAGATQQIARVQDLANFIRAYRAADSPWPQSPRTERVFELELALVGLMGETGFVHEEGLKLLTNAHLLVERMGPADAFACSWFLAEAAAFEGLWRPELAIAFVERAARACPGEPRLRLAHAVLLEQQWQRQREPAQVQDIVSAYKKVDGAAAAEALVRAAGLCAAAGELSDALALLQSAPVSTDPYVRYLYELTKGHVLRKQGHAEESVAAYTRALDAWPGAQSARVSLMTALMQLGRLDEAGALSEAVQTAPRMNTDPWWTYYRGDFRDYPALLANLRAIN